MTGVLAVLEQRGGRSSYADPGGAGYVGARVRLVNELSVAPRRPASNEQIHAAIGVTHAAISLTYVDGGVGWAGAGVPHGDDGVIHASVTASQASSGVPHGVECVIQGGRGVNHAPFGVNQADDGVNVGDVGVLHRARSLRRAARPTYGVIVTIAKAFGDALDGSA